MAAKENSEDLLAFVKEIANAETVSVEEDLGHGYVRLRVTEAERRQALQDIRCVEDVVKELVRNARDAGADRIYVSFQKEKGRWRHLHVLDNGKGIPPELHRKIFEARVTSKVADVVEDHFGVHGRGMALFSIRQVVEEIRLVDSALGRGTIIHARIDTHRVPEKKDQSTFPRLETDEDGRLAVAGGPRNVPRILAEFALDAGGTEIYFGSNSEILSTLYHHSTEMRKHWAMGVEGTDRPLWFELGGIKDGKSLHRFATQNLALAVSERNAFRVLEYEIPPLMSVNELLGGSRGERCVRRADLQRKPKPSWGDHLARRLSPQDISFFADRLRDAFAAIGERSWLTAEDPVIRRRKDRLVITLKLHEKEEE
ncbi:MAG: sensor histidine kinase [Actinobacteria bacterium]|nr:sensor histidine kinase [Actinomycetota bacterium]